MIYQKASAYAYEQSEESSLHKATTRSSSRDVSSSQARRAGTRTAQVFMFGALMIAAAICVAHHIFLFVINGRNVEDFAISQTWIRDIGNALAWLAQFLLQLSIGVALTQSIWLYAQRNRVTLNDLDVLFSLPAFWTWTSTLFKPSVLYVVLLAVLIQALTFVGIFAPNALSVVPADPKNSTLRVPIPSLDRIPATTSSYWLQSGFDLPCDDPTSQCVPHFLYMNPSSSFQRLARGVLDGGVIFPWSAPSGCGRGCNYEVGYWGPALKCAEVPQSSIAVFNTNFTRFNAANATVDPSIQVSSPTHFLEGAYVYNATTSFGYGTSWTTELVPIFQSFPYGRPFSLDVVYATNDFTLPFALSKPIYYNMTGYSCTFHNATYSASVKYLNGSQTTSARVVGYGGQLGPVSDPGDVNASYVYGSDAGFLSLYAAMGLAGAMSQYIYGSIAFSTDSANDFPALAPVYTSVLSSIFTTNASFTGESNVLSLPLISTSYHNLGDLLQDACTNLTASLMSDTAGLGLYAQVPAEVTPDINVYRYQAYRLWAVYGTALGVTLLAALYGLACIVKNGGAMQRTFSSIAASVRDRNLDMLVNEPGESLPPRAQNVKLRYRAGGSVRGERAGFKMAEDARDEDDVEMSETAALNGVQHLES